MEKEFWNKEISNEDKIKIESLFLDDKDINTDFFFIHNDDFIENINGSKHEIVFFEENCVWQIVYVEGSQHFRLECISYNNLNDCKKAFENLKDKLFQCDDCYVLIEMKNLTTYFVSFYS